MVGAPDPPGEVPGDDTAGDGGNGGAVAEGDHLAARAILDDMERAAAEGGGDVVRRGLGFGDGVLGRRWIGVAGVRVGDSSEVADRPDVRVGRNAERGFDDDAALAVVLNRQCPGQGVRLDADRADDGVGGDAGAVLEDDGVGFDLDDWAVEEQVNAAPVQHALGVVAQGGRGFGQEPLEGVDEDDAVIALLQAAVVVEGAAEQFLDRGREFDAGCAAADDDDGEQGAAEFTVVGGLGLFEQVDEVVAQREGMAETLDLVGVLVDAGDVEGGRDAAEREDEVVVGKGQLVGRAVIESVADVDELGVEIDRLDAAHQQAGVRGDEADRREDVFNADLARDDLRQERVVDEGVVAADEHDVGLAGPEVVLECLRDGDAREAAAENDDARAGGARDR